MTINSYLTNSKIQHIQMSKEASTGNLKLLAGILAFTILGLAYYTFSYYKTQEVKTKRLLAEKQKIKEDLEDMQIMYEEAKETLSSNNKELELARQTILELQDQVSQMELSFEMIKKYRAEVMKLRREKRELFTLADSLDKLNQQLVLERNRATGDLEDYKKQNGELAAKNEKVSKSLIEAMKLSAVDVKAHGVRVKGNGKIEVLDKAKKADKIRVCFKFARNMLADSGERTVYTIIKDPKGNIVGKSTETFPYRGENLNYSASRTIYFENKTLDVCMFVKKKEELPIGKYLAYIYVDGNQIGDTAFFLN